MNPFFFAGGEVEAFEGGFLRRIAVGAVEMALEQHGGVELGAEFLRLPQRFRFARTEFEEPAAFAVAGTKKHAVTVHNWVAGIQSIFCDPTHAPDLLAVRKSDSQVGRS